jgi:hypothetical protein
MKLFNYVTRPYALGESIAVMVMERGRTIVNPNSRVGRGENGVERRSGRE